MGSRGPNKDRMLETSGVNVADFMLSELGTESKEI